MCSSARESFRKELRAHAVANSELLFVFLAATQSYSLAEYNVKGQDIIVFVSHKTVMMIL